MPSTPHGPPAVAAGQPVTVALVGCGKLKTTESAPAAELYIGPLFRKAVDYARRYADCWYVLSGLHGLVIPDQVLHPYDRSLNDASLTEREWWASQVDTRLRRRHATDEHVRVIVLAGAAYRMTLVPRLRRWATVETPLAGLRIGAQLAWLSARIDTPAPA